jgi:hypothetical protein
MKIPPNRSQQTANATNPQGKPLFAGEPAFESISRQAGLLGNPLDALQALEQWRMQEEDTQRQPYRWDSYAMPLRICLEAPPGPLLPGMPSVPELWMTLKQWEAASQGLIRLTLVDDTPWAAKAADIVITWSEEITPGRDFEVGHTQRTVQGKHITHAVITLIIQPAIDKHLSPAKQAQRLHATILHEVGHALGLEHATDKRDVMHHRGWQRTVLSAGDIRRIQQLYSPHKPLHV